MESSGKKNGRKSNFPKTSSINFVSWLLKSLKKSTAVSHFAAGPSKKSCTELLNYYKRQREIKYLVSKCWVSVTIVFGCYFRSILYFFKHFRTSGNYGKRCTKSFMQFITLYQQHIFDGERSITAKISMAFRFSKKALTYLPFFVEKYLNFRIYLLKPFFSKWKFLYIIFQNGSICRIIFIFDVLTGRTPWS